jgi:hypothetical protein
MIAENWDRAKIMMRGDDRRMHGDSFTDSHMLFPNALVN